MKICPSCKKAAEDSARFCENCGYSFGNESTGNEGPEKNTNEQEGNPSGSNSGNQSKGFDDKAKDFFNDFNNTSDSTGEYSADDIEKNKVYSVFAYLGILVIVPILGAPESKFARFHANQGLLLLITSAIYGVINGTLSFYAGLFNGFYIEFIKLLLFLPNLLLVALLIIGIINAVNGKAKELPIIGKYRILK